MGDTFGWISIDDNLPEINREVLIYSTDVGFLVGVRDEDFSKNFIDDQDCFIFCVTHWMSLPKAPVNLK